MSHTAKRTRGKPKAAKGRQLATRTVKIVGEDFACDLTIETARGFFAVSGNVAMQGDAASIDGSDVLEIGELVGKLCSRIIASQNAGKPARKRKGEAAEAHEDLTAPQPPPTPEAKRANATDAEIVREYDDGEGPIDEASA